MKQVFKTEVAGRELVFETGELAQLANGAVLVRYGETVVISTATASAKPREGMDYFPLSVDYEEKMYAVGKIPGGFIKREGRPTEKAMLTARAIDRFIRPLFPKDIKNEVTVVNTVMSVEQDNSPEFAALVGTATAINISDIPFNGPTAGILIGLVDDEVVFNPTSEQKEKSILTVTLAGTKEKITMIEACGNEISEEKMLEAISKGHDEIKKIIEFIEKVTKKAGKKDKFEYESQAIDEELFNVVKEYGYKKVEKALFEEEKTQRDKNIREVTDDIQEYLDTNFEDKEWKAGEAIYLLQKKIVRENILNKGKRVDGRKLMDLRELSSSVGLLPRVHGSGLFSRGQTQVMTILTLGALRDAQMLDGLDLEDEKRYIHHYNFPSYSVGETRPSRGPGRREIGHGALAEKALIPVLPTEDEFPYAIRLVSEIFMSNGSTSQGSICGSTLALMDAGVPIKEPVAGISAGLVSDDENPDKYVTFMDIQGIEDFFGDMDFKVAGTKNGITAIQVDIKLDGLTLDIIKEAFDITKEGRLKILESSMLKTIEKPRETLSEYANKVYRTKIDVDKIRDVIGPGGKVINRIIDETGVKIDIEEDGRVFVGSMDKEMGEKAVKIIEGIAGDIKKGEIYTGKVVKIAAFGAFVEILPGKEGLVHISKLENKRVNKVEDVVKEGDVFPVKVLDVDRQGKISLSRKDAMKDDKKA
jgi:polyribonucleotide nucleotidyltransferase